MDETEDDWFTTEPAKNLSRRGQRKPPPEYIECPFTVVVDSREQSNWDFKNFRADARQKRLPLVVRTVTKGLKSGDYSIEGIEDRISVERKSLSDLYSTLGQGRERFERELQRLSEMEVAAVVIEADWRTIIENPPEESKLSPKSVFRSINAWEQEFPTIHWHAMWSRDMAERKCFRILERFWIREQRRLKEAEKVAAVKEAIEVAAMGVRFAVDLGE